MRRNDQILLVALAAVGVLVAFWIVALSPKRNEAASLKDDVDQLQGQLAAAQQEAAAGEESRKTFDTNYRRLVVLGKAVPADSEQASLLVQLQRLADRSNVEFQTFDLSSSGSTTPAPVTPTPPSGPSTGSVDSTTTVAAPAVPTEASAATLPIGASVGPAGLAVMPYDLKFTGGFFEIAEFMRRVDSLVHMQHGLPGVNGRLVTVDGFTLAPESVGTTSAHGAATPTLGADLTVTTYLTPADQGITAGATPSGPAPATATPTSTTATPSTSTSAPTSTSDTTAVTP